MTQFIVRSIADLLHFHALHSPFYLEDVFGWITRAFTRFLTPFDILLPTPLFREQPDASPPLEDSHDCSPCPPTTLCFTGCLRWSIIITRVPAAS